MIDNNTYYLCLDVESMGLYGRAFSLGYVLLSPEGETITEEYLYSSWSYNKSIMEGQKDKWVMDNVIPYAGEYNTRVSLEATFCWKHYQPLLGRYGGNKNDKLIVVADCPFPVETNFLSSCVDLFVETQDWLNIGLYPILDIESIKRMTPKEKYITRGLDEVPVHHPLKDARFTAREFKTYYLGL